MVADDAAIQGLTADPVDHPGFVDNGDGGWQFTTPGFYEVTYTVRVVHNTAAPPAFSLSQNNAAVPGAAPGSVVSSQFAGVPDGSVVTLTKSVILQSEPANAVWYIQNVSGAAGPQTIRQSTIGGRFASAATLTARLVAPLPG